jgi:predicted phage-related endonuclease
MQTDTHTTQEDNWLAARQRGIGGSDAPTILGVNPYEQPFELFARKMGLLEPRPASPPMQWGKRLEPVIVDWYREETRRRVIRGDQVRGAKGPPIGHATEIEYRDAERILLRSTRHSFMIGTPDAFVFDPDRGWGVLEIKTSRSPDAWKDRPSPYAMAQLHHYLELTGLEWGAFAVLFAGQDAGHTDVKRDPELCESILDAERSFWKRLETNDPPEPDDSESTLRTLREIYQRGDGETIELDDRAASPIATYLEMRELEKIGREGKRKAETLLRALLGSASEGITPDGAVVKRVDVAPAKIEAYTRASSSYLRIKPAE